jgi:hypothetical protein
MLPNMESEKLAVVIMLVTDIVLVLTMLLGLLRWNRRGGGMFELGRLLWKQVSGGSDCCDALHPLMYSLFVRALSGSSLPQWLGSLQWQV